MRIHHIGYLVKDINKAVLDFENLSYIVSKQGIIYDSIRDIDLCFISNGEYTIELVSPKSSDSVVYDLMRKLGNSPYHICYEVDDIQTSIKELRSKGYLPIQSVKAAVGIENRKVAFLMNKNIGMIELVEG